MKPKQREKYLIISDLHVPDYDIKALDLVLRFIPHYQPTTIDLLGDFINFTKISKYDQDPYYKTDLADEIEEGRGVLKHIVSVARKVNPNVEINYYEGNHECFSEDTEILTKDGWMKHTDITPETILGTYNKNRDLIEWEKPLEIQRYNHDGLLNNIKNRHTDLLITDKHRLHFSYSGSTHWYTDSFENMTVGNNRVTFKCSSSENNPEYPISDDEIKISAWVITDGCMRPDRVNFYQRESKHKLITNILDNLGWKYSVGKRQRNVTEICGVKINKPQPSMVIGLLGKDKDKLRRIVPNKKELPTWVYELSDRQFEVFLQSFIDGDGSRHKSSPETSLMVYGEKTILEQLQTACFTHGYRTSFYTYRGKDYKLNVTKNKTTCFDGFKDYVSKVHYQGIVWDVTTPNDTVIVKRNGRITITGNCRLTKYLGRNANQLADLTADDEYIVSIPHLFELKKLGVKWIRGDKVVQRHGVTFFHGAAIRIKSGFSAHANIDKFGTSGFTGHTHRLAHITRTQSRVTKFWVETGCLCNQIPTPSYAVSPDWCQGFAVAEYSPQTRQFYPQVIPIIDHSFVYDGKIFT